MAKMTAMQAAVRALESEGVRVALGVPGAAAYQHAGGADPDGLGRHRRRSPAQRRHGRPADAASLRQRHLPRQRLRARDRQPLGQPAHRQHPDL